MYRNNGSRTIEEGLQSMGLDPAKVLGEMDRMTGALQSRAADPRASMDPPVPGAASVHSNLTEANANSGGASKPQAAASAKFKSFLDEAKAQLKAEGKNPEDLEEAFKIVKKLRHTAREKLKARAERRRARGKRRKASRMYRKRNKRKIMIRAKRKLAKFGSKTLSKLHKAGKRIMVAHADFGLGNLIEDIATTTTDETKYQYESPAHNAGLLSMYLGEVFEAMGDSASAETMYTMSDLASDLADELSAVETMSEGQETKLRKVLEGVVKALRVYEGIGSPSLFDALEVSAEAAE